MKLYEVKYEEIFSPETLNSLKGKSGENLRQNFQGKNLYVLLKEMMELLPAISKAEYNYRDILTMIAIDMVKKAYPIIEYADIEIEANIQDQINLNIPDKEEDEDENKEGYPSDKINILSHKRKIINGITQGSAIRGAFAFYLFREYIDDLDETLVEKYNQICKLAFGVFDDDNYIALMLAALAQNGAKGAGGKSHVEFEKGKLKIKAVAINFPFLVHEIVKGLYEILSLQGFSSNAEMNKKIVDKVDKVTLEPYDMKYGKFIYDTINDLYISSDIDDPRVRELLFVEIYKLENTEFISFIENAINKNLSPSQKTWVYAVIREIYDDLKADDSGF